MLFDMGNTCHLIVFVFVVLCFLVTNSDLSNFSLNFQDVPSILFEWKPTDTLPIDPTWKEYIHLVYGSNVSPINITQIDMVYTLTSVVEFYFDPGKWVYGVFPTFLNSMQQTGRVYQNFEWAEVIRMSTKCFVRHNLKMHGHQFYEGMIFPINVSCHDPVLLLLS